MSSQVITTLLNNQYGLSECRIIKTERRLYGFVYLVVCKEGAYVLKLTSAVSTNQAEDQLNVVAKPISNANDFYFPKFKRRVNDKQGSYVSMTKIDDNEYIVSVSQFIPGLTRYKDMWLNGLRISPFIVIGQLHSYWKGSSDAITAGNRQHQIAITYSDRVVYYKNNLDSAVEKYRNLQSDEDMSLRIIELLNEKSMLSIQDETTQQIVHGNLANNIFLDSQLRSVIMDFDNVHWGFPMDDLARLIANCNAKDIAVYVSGVTRHIEDYVQYFHIQNNSSLFLVYLQFSLAYELVECLSEFDKYAAIAGKDEVTGWVSNKVERLVAYLDNI